MKEIAARESGLTVEQVVDQVQAIQELMSRLMKEGEHYGKIPGCYKPTLLKPGAEKLCLMFNLAPEYKVQRREINKMDVEYIVECSLLNKITGKFVGGGVGSCSTLESKYLKSRNKADLYNTVLKMAKKRALVDAVLTATAASDIFVQDMEDSQPEPAKPEAELKTGEMEKVLFDGLDPQNFEALMKKINSKEINMKDCYNLFKYVGEMEDRFTVVLNLHFETKKSLKECYLSAKKHEYNLERSKKDLK
jgi:hypothetical protein